MRIRRKGHRGKDRTTNVWFPRSSFETNGVRRYHTSWTMGLARKYQVDELTLPVIWCTLVLPFRQRVIIVGQNHLIFRVVILVRPAKNHVERQFPLRQVQENVSTEVRSEVVITTRRAKGHLLGRRRDGCAEEDLVMEQSQVNTTDDHSDQVNVRCSRIPLSVFPLIVPAMCHRTLYTDQTLEGG